MVEAKRTERDLPIRVVLFGAVAIVAMMWALLTFRPIPGAETGLRREPAGGDFRGGIRLPVCDRVGAYLRAHRQFVESDQRDGDRYADGDVRDVPGGRLDARQLCRCWR